MIERIVRSENVVWNLVDGEAVLLNTTTGIYFGMNKTATAIWSIIETPITTEEVVQEMTKRFEADRMSLANDVTDLIAILESKQLINTLRN